MTRLTVSLSRCWRNHKAVPALWLGYYNLCRSQRSLKMPLAKKARLTRRLWSMRDLLEDAMAPPPKFRYLTPAPL